jgi:hypothetical protein
MVAIRLSDFLPILKPQQGNLLACALLPDTILNTTAAHKLLKQLVNAKDDLKYFAMPIAFVCVGAVLAKNLINIGMAFRYRNSSWASVMGCRCNTSLWVVIGIDVLGCFCSKKMALFWYCLFGARSRLLLQY